jgi:kanosamine 6-kinase
MAILALDLGGTKLAGVRVDDAGRADERRIELPRHGDAERELDEVVRFAVDLAERGGEPLGGAALAAAPTLGADGRVTRWPNRPHWAGVALVPRLESALGCALAVEDDGNAAAWAEAEAAAVDDLVYLGLGTGVAGGLVLGGRVHHGRHAAAGEIGHVVVDPDGPACRCGRRGCLQALASGPALQAASDGPSLPRAIEGLARIVVVVSELLDPAVIAIGGGAAAVRPGLVGRVAVAAAGCARRGQRLPDLRPAFHGERASLEGAVLLARALDGGRRPS